MSTAQSIVVPPPDFCRMAVGRVLACVALLAFLALHTSMVWHGPEHALNESSRVREAATSFQTESTAVAMADIAAATPNTATAEDAVSPPSAAVVSHVEQVSSSSSSSELCLKCLEDVAHTVCLTSQAVHLAASRSDDLRPPSLPVCLFATPVELANQRGPPAFLS
jgi:hypothetical protein